MSFSKIKIHVAADSGARLRPMTKEEEALKREDFEYSSDWYVHILGLDRHIQPCPCDCCYNPEDSDEVDYCAGCGNVINPFNECTCYHSHRDDEIPF